MLSWSSHRLIEFGRLLLEHYLRASIIRNFKIPSPTRRLIDKFERFSAGIIYHAVATIPCLNLLKPKTNEGIFNHGIKRIKNTNLWSFHESTRPIYLSMKKFQKDQLKSILETPEFWLKFVYFINLASKET